MLVPLVACRDGSSVVWNRTLSREVFTTPYDRVHACSSLKQALNRLQLQRLVRGCAAACVVGWNVVGIVLVRLCDEGGGGA